MKPMLSNMVFCWRFLKKNLPMLLIWCFFSVTAQILLPLLEMYLPKIVILQIETGQSVERLITVALGMTIAMAILSGWLKFTDRYVYLYKLLSGNYWIREMGIKSVLTDYQNLEKEDFRKKQMGAFYAVNTNESQLRNIVYIWIGLAAGSVSFGICLAVMAEMSIWVLLFLLATAAASFFMQDLSSKWVEKHKEERNRYNSHMGYVQKAAGELKSAKDIRLYRIDHWLHAVHSDNMEKLMGWYSRYGRVVIRTSCGTAGISMLREGIAYVYLLYLVLKGQITVSDFVLYLAAITNFSGSLQRILQNLGEMRRASIAISEYRSFVEYPEIFVRAGGRKVSTKQPQMIELRHVSYRYSGDARDVIKDLSLIIRPGEHIGIVGLNGTGKTTLMKLICGLCDPTEGEILYGGVNIKELDRMSYYEAIAAVFQQYSVLPVAIENVVSESGLLDTDKVRECLKTAGLWEKIEALPMKEKTLIDPSVNEGGVSLSGGQLQKLLLARAIYKNAPILVLDEPTAALDPLSENRLYEIYHTITEGKTSLFISHRLASTRFCSRILLMNQGRLEEEGTHEELLANRGLYYDLFETQARYYREHPEKEVTADV